MKIKKFKNLWLMGLIIFGAILIVLYFAKLVFPEFVIGVAEMPTIVKFGEYVDSHLWAYYIFTFVTSFFAYYFYCCACCRKKRLSIVDMCIVSLTIILLFIVEKFLTDYYFGINLTTLLVLPTIICKLDKENDIRFLYSTATSFTIYYFAQMLSLEIRGISTTISYPNSATYTILLTDVYICLVLLFNFYNFREVKHNG